MSTDDERNDRATQILDVAEALVQTRGFNGFSYADIAVELGITKASVHYHFSSKSELGSALVCRYTDRFAESLTAIGNGSGDSLSKLKSYINLYLEVLTAERMCLCGMLAAEYSTIPKPMRKELVRFFEQNEAWLTELLEAGRNERKFEFSGSPTDSARMITSTLEGALLVARPFGEIARFEQAANRLVASLIPAGQVIIIDGRA